MVQGDKQMPFSMHCSSRNPDSRKAGYESVQQHERMKMKEREQQQQQQQKNNATKDKYGSWGSTFKNRENFVNMHLC